MGFSYSAVVGTVVMRALSLLLEQVFLQMRAYLHHCPGLYVLRDLAHTLASIFIQALNEKFLFFLRPRVLDLLGPHIFGVD